MSVLAQAASDLRSFLEDDSTGFGQAFTVTSPAQVSAEVKGYSADIGRAIDPETGLPVSGRVAHVALPIAALREAFGALPEGVPDSASKPWLVTVTQPNGPGPQTFKVEKSEPDLLGVLLCHLDAYA